jgi:signal transduction histidine kinase/DNA-binding LacI/PurR family transcriptional regulator/CheY-like chemotaxis protein
MGFFLAGNAPKKHHMSPFITVIPTNPLYSYCTNHSKLCLDKIRSSSVDNTQKIIPKGKKPATVPKRLTIGFLLASLHTGASLTIWPGLLEAARRHDVNLICFPGGRLHAAESFEVQRNFIFELATDEYLDGLITWSSTLGGVLGPAEIQAFHERYHPLTMVSLAQFMEGMPTVSLDNYLGMRSLLAHLIEVHGYHRLAFIRGPEEHYYAQERYRAYLDALQAYNLPLAPDLVTRPLSWESGNEAVQILLDERGLQPGLDFQAVVASSDMMALLALKNLQARGFRVPDDVAVTGFNNSVEERLATPPLTTVELPFYEQGAKAMDVLLRLLSGESVPALITLPSKLIVRQSCGCPSAAIAQALYSPSHVEVARQVKAVVNELRSDCLSEMVAAIGPAPEDTSGWMGGVFDAFIYDLENLSAARPSRHFLSALDSVLDQAIQANYDIVPWQNALSTLRRWTLPVLPDQERAEVEALFSQARVVLAEAVQRYHAYWQWRADRDAENLREMNRALLTTFDIQQLTGVLVERLPGLGIPSVFLALYEPGTHAGASAQARLVLAYSDNEQAPLEPGGRLFPTRQLVPPDLLPRHRRYSLVAEPLYFQEKPLGYVVFEIGPYEGNVYELLRNNLSSALQGALLFQEIQQARLAAEKADHIKTRLLANVTHEMRTPLNIILGYTQDALRVPNKYGEVLPSVLADDIHQIQSNAEHQLRVINDLLDLSRAEIDELDLSLELLNPHQLLVDAFRSFADQSTSPDIHWKFDIPERLPQIRADPMRLRQIFLNLLSNAKKYTEKGEITLGAEVAPPHIHFWVVDTGFGIDPEQQERIFEPFVTLEDNRRIAGGIGLGLSITRHLVALHNGTMTLESQPGVGSAFHIYLPLPAFNQAKPAKQDNPSSVLLLISSQDEPQKEILEMCQRQNLEIFRLLSSEDLEAALNTTKPVALAWDLSSARPGDWAIVRRLRHYPNLSQAPFILYDQLAGDQMGMTGFVVKSTNTQSLLDAIIALNPGQAAGPVLIVDDEPQVRQSHRMLVERGLPGCPIRLAENGEAALAAMQKEVPSLVLLDLVMPNLGGADVLDQMRADPRLCQVPVIILSNKLLSLEDVKRVESYTRVKLQSKGIWSDAETVVALNQAVLGTDALSASTSGVVKRAIAYIHQNYTRSISRWEIAEAVGVSEDYLSRVFNRELSISPWDYLNRYRVLQSRHLLLHTADTIGAIARQVGFKDQAYFSRVFHKVTGMSPQGFRESNRNSLTF